MAEAVTEKDFKDAIAAISDLIAATIKLKEAYQKGDDTTNLKTDKETKSALVNNLLAALNAKLSGAPAAPAAVPEGAATAAALARATSLVPEKEKTDGGGKPRKSKRALRGGADAAVAPSDVVPSAVYNVQGMLAESHDPYLVGKDASIAAASQLHAPFSAGVVGDVNLQTTADLTAGLMNRIAPPIAGGGKRKASAGKKAKK